MITADIREALKRDRPLTVAQQDRLMLAWVQSGRPEHVFVPGFAPAICVVCACPPTGRQHTGWCMGSAEHGDHTFNQGAHCPGLPDLTKQESAQNELAKLAQEARDAAAPGYEDAAEDLIGKAFELGRQS